MPLTDRSGTVTTGGVAQSLMPSNTSRHGFYIQNLSVDDLWISSVGTASASVPSLKLFSKAYYEASKRGVPSAAISIYGATTGQAFTAGEW